MANRLTQIAREVLEKNGAPNARLTQVAREALQQGGAPNARLTQIAREALVRLGYLRGDAGIPSSAAFGLGAVAQGDPQQVIEGASGIASGYAAGATGAILCANEISGTAGLPSAEGFGAGAAQYDQFLSGEAGIASATAFGAGIVSGGLKGTEGIPSGGGFGSTGATLGAQPFTLFVAGVDRTDKLMVGTMSATFTLNQPASGKMTLYDPAGEFRPDPGADVAYYAGTERIFGGTIEDTAEESYIGSQAISLECSLAGYGAICDHRIIGKFYTTWMGGIASITIADICRNYLEADGIGYRFSGDPGVDLGEQLFNYVTVTEALNSIAGRTGWQWMIGADKILRFFPAATGTTPAPFSLADNDGKWRNMQVSRSRSAYRNRQGVRPSQNLLSTWTDSFTGNGAQRFFVSTYQLTVVPIVRVNGVQQVIATYGQLPGDYSSWDWYWIPDGNGVSQNWTKPPLGLGDTIEIDYPSPLPMIFWMQDDAEIARRAAIEGGSGIYEAVEEANDVVDETAALQLAAGLLARYCHSGIPRELRFETDLPGLAPGQTLTSAVTRPAAAGDFLITQVQISEVDGARLRYQIDATSAASQGNWLQFYRDLIYQTKPPADRIIEKCTFWLAVSVPGQENPGLVTGTSLTNVWIAKKKGIVKDVTIFAKTAPVGADIRIDITKNGTSIFGAAPLLTFPAGGTAPVTQFQFAVPNLPIAPNDILECNVIQVGSTTPGADVTVVLTMWG